MKKYFYICFIFLLAASCKKDTDYTKSGVSLPTVNNLSIQQAETGKVKLAWTIPGNLPAEINQPISINVEVYDILTPTKAVSIFATQLANAPNEYIYTLPTAASPKTYHFIVKLFGTTKVVDKNYSSTIYSLGQTVEYKK